MMIAIFANAIVIFLLYFPQIESGEPFFLSVLDVIDHIFIIVFL